MDVYVELPASELIQFFNNRFLNKAVPLHFFS